VSVVARRYGGGDKAGCVAAWRRALPWATLTAGFGAAIFWQTETILSLLGQKPALAAGAGAVAKPLAPGLMLQVLYVTCAYYLEAVGRPKPALVAMIAANLLNAALNYGLIYGNLGAPELGAVGSAIATSLSRLFLFGALLICILRREEMRAALAAGVSGPLGGGFWGPGGWRAGAELRRIGLAAGLSVFFETSAFGAMTLMAGLIGPAAVAAYSIAHNVEATIFMFALGLAVATGVRVGGEAGAGRRAEAAFVGWIGLGVCATLMAGVGGALWLFSPQIAAFYTSDPALAVATLALLPFVALSAAPLGMQIVAGQCNRALGDAYVSSAFYFAAFWLIMIPAGGYLAFTLGLGAQGLMIATMMGAVASTALQAGRFHLLTRR
jgi:MATE family multidrug resistance protein